ncbi:MAG: hypothetical protein ACFBQW_01220 [Sphingomonadaceae bacterium]
MRCAVPFLLSALLAGCNESSDAGIAPDQYAGTVQSRDAPAEPNAKVAAFASEASASPATDYGLMKDVARDLLARNPDGEFSDPSVEDQFRFFRSYMDEEVADLEDCGSLSSLGMKPARSEEIDRRASGEELAADQLEEIATYRIGTEAFLRRAGYRKEVYQAPLRAYEREALEIVFEGEELGYELKERLAQRMERRRSSLQPDMPAIGYHGGCGAGETAFTFAFDPPNGTAWLIRVFDFELCRRRFPEPWNVDGACRDWREASDDTRMMLSGNYVYQASWPNGTTRRGTKTALGDPMAEINVMTFRARR